MRGGWREANGHHAAYDAWDDCDDRIRALVEQIEPISATTLAGLVAKTNAVLLEAVMWEDHMGESNEARVFKTFIAEMKRMGAMS
ncbi:hypothetical protein ACG873_01375 (plasmid) [Mesorhizobium sp. AaZ16]|uniref:hypothetical protein n=1 Tax=Mesorhizobium sp. AaZ16 TaxID=3402289 RepID=UPI00374F372F